MKKLITLTCAFVLALSLNSCGGSDDSPSGSSTADKIVGTWRYAGDIYGGVFEPEDYEACDDEFLKFAANNTGQMIEKYCGEASDVYTFTWEKTANPLFNYAITDTETGETAQGIIVFSADFQKFTAYDSEEEMLAEDAGEVYEKQ